MARFLPLTPPTNNGCAGDRGNGGGRSRVQHAVATTPRVQEYQGEMPRKCVRLVRSRMELCEKRGGKRVSRQRSPQDAGPMPQRTSHGKHGADLQREEGE